MHGYVKNKYGIITAYPVKYKFVGMSALCKTIVVISEALNIFAVKEPVFLAEFCEYFHYIVKAASL